MCCAGRRSRSNWTQVRRQFRLPASHTRTALVERFGENIGGLLWDRFTVHYTPKHGSWLNQAEIEISLFARQCLGRRRIRTPQELQPEARASDRNMNRDRVTANW